MALTLLYISHSVAHLPDLISLLCDNLSVLCNIPTTRLLLEAAGQLAARELLKKQFTNLESDHSELSRV